MRQLNCSIATMKLPRPCPCNSQTEPADTKSAVRAGGVFGWGGELHKRLLSALLPLAVADLGPHLPFLASDLAAAFAPSLATHRNLRHCGDCGLPAIPYINKSRTITLAGSIQLCCGCSGSNRLDRPQTDPVTPLGPDLAPTVQGLPWETGAQRGSERPNASCGIPPQSEGAVIAPKARSWLARTTNARSHR